MPSASPQLLAGEILAQAAEAGRLRPSPAADTVMALATTFLSDSKSVEVVAVWAQVAMHVMRHVPLERLRDEVRYSTGEMLHIVMGFTAQWA